MGRVYIEVQTMSTLRIHGGLNKEASEVNSRYMASPNDIAVYIKRVRKSALPLFSATIGSSLWKIGPKLCPRTVELSSYLKISK